MRVLLIVAIAVGLIVPTSAHAALIADTEGLDTARYESWNSLAKVPLPTGDIYLREFSGQLPYCARNADACFLYPSAPQYRRIIQMRTTSKVTPRLAYYHELGHAFDDSVLKPRQRRRFQHIMGIAGSKWITSDYETTPHEEFARAYAACARHGGKPPRAVDGWIIDSKVEYAATVKQYRATCKLIANAAKGDYLDYGSQPVTPSAQPTA